MLLGQGALLHRTEEVLCPVQFIQVKHTPWPSQEWSSTYRQTCDQSANQLIYTAKFGLIGSLSYATVEPGAYLAFTSTRMTITTPIQASNLFNSWTDSYSGSSLCASERQGGVYFIMRVLNTVGVRVGGWVGGWGCAVT